MPTLTYAYVALHKRNIYRHEKWEYKNEHNRWKIECDVMLFLLIDILSKC